MLARHGTPTPAPLPEPPPVEPWPDTDHESLPADYWPPEEAVAVPAPVLVAPLPEAPCSVNCHVTIAGRQVQVTLRGTSEDEVLTRLERVLTRYPLPQAPAQPLSPQQQGAAAMGRPTTGFCARHSVNMKWNEGKEGRKGWFSHRTEDGWCKGHGR